jgi:hypothetical protein
MVQENNMSEESETAAFAARAAAAKEKMARDKKAEAEARKDAEEAEKKADDDKMMTVIPAHPGYFFVEEYGTAGDEKDPWGYFLNPIVSWYIDPSDPVSLSMGAFGIGVDMSSSEAEIHPTILCPDGKVIVRCAQSFAKLEDFVLHKKGLVGK